MSRPPGQRGGLLRALGRLGALMLLAGLMLQLVFALRIAAMAWVDPASTAFERSEAWRLLSQRGALPWRQEWRPLTQIAPSLQRAVIAAEDASFTEHDGIDWDALEKAWDRNQRAQARAEARPGRRPPKVVGGSTISQQLAKNLFLSGERTLPRKAQEAAITLVLEVLLDKRRILEIYLNHVEWGEGVFGAEAAAQHYFRRPAAGLAPMQAARLAVMLPAPKRFERRPGSPYVAGRAATILGRMGAVELP